MELTCCGRDNGVEIFSSWEEADKFRESYTSGVAVNPHGYSAHPTEAGHKRSAVISSPCAHAERVKELEAELDATIVTGRKREERIVVLEQVAEVAAKRPNKFGPHYMIWQDAMDSALRHAEGGK